MKSKKILILSTYPIKDPRHGGQKRLDAIYEAYKGLQAIVKHSAVFYKGFYSKFGSDDIPLSRVSEELLLRSPLTGDIICGQAISQDPHVRKKIISLLKTFKPDIIHIEQPFPYIGLKAVLKDLNVHPSIIFGSQNIEAPMKREILEGAGVPEAEIKEAEAIIEAVEAELSSKSDLMMACTRADLDVHLRYGARMTVLAPNGIAPIRTDESSKVYWDNTFKKIGVEKIALFVGSAHPPNWAGFLQMVGTSLGFISEDARIVAAGSISDYLEREVLSDAPDISSATFWLRAYSAGRLSETRLGALIKKADVLILPITEGGGSNLKTAEAILANKKVVTTSHALRSFEWFASFPNVWVADTMKDFQGAIVKAMRAEFINRTPRQEAQAKKVEWTSCLSDMVKAVSRI